MLPVGSGQMLWGLLRRLFGRRPVAAPSQPSPFDGTADWLRRLPASVAFCDVETTGLTTSDRIVSFGGIGLKTAALADGKFDVAFSYLLFDPGRKSHPKAEQVHGYGDWTLRFQDPFSLYAEEISAFLSSYELLVAHNAEFDFEFLDREMMLVGMPPLPQPVYCTMQGYRQLGLGGSASLNAVCKRINLVRAGSLHTWESSLPAAQRCRSTPPSVPTR